MPAGLFALLRNPARQQVHFGHQGTQNLDVTRHGIVQVAGPADLSVGYGHTALGSPDLDAALTRIGAAARTAGRGYATWVPDAATAAKWRHYGMGVWFVGSDHALMLGAARAVVKGFGD